MNIRFQNADNLASLSQISTNVMVSFEGTITWLSTGIFRSSCSIDVQYFPFGKKEKDLFRFGDQLIDKSRWTKLYAEIRLVDLR